MRKHVKKVDRRGTNSSRSSQKTSVNMPPDVGGGLGDSLHEHDGGTAQPVPASLDQLLQEKTAEVAELHAQVDALMKGHKQLAASLDDRLRELAALTVMLEARDEEVFSRLANELAIQQPAKINEVPRDGGSSSDRPRKTDHAEAVAPVVDQSQVMELSKEVDALRTEIETARGELIAARKQITTLERDRNKSKAELQARFEETANLTMMLEAATGDVAKLKQQLSSRELTQARDASSKRAFSPQKLFSTWSLWPGQKTNNKPNRNIKAELDVVRRSKYFDADWYLATYPDVAQSGMDAAVHFVKFGALEGRDPGPLFSTKAYLVENPDAVERNMNPLMHAVMYGKRTD